MQGAQQVRTISIPAREASDVILRFCRQHDFHDVQTDSLKNGYRIVARGDAPGRFFLSPSPRIVLAFELSGDAAEQTTIQFRKDQTRKFKKWYWLWLFASLPVLLCMGASLFLPMAIQVDSSWRIGLFLGTSIPLWALFALFFGGSSLELQRVNDGLFALESDLWCALEGTGHRLVMVSDHGDDRLDSAIFFVLMLASIGLVAWALWHVGFRKASIVFVIFLVLPFVLVEVAGLAIRGLPFRFGWWARRLPFGFSWFALMFLPYVFLLGVNRSELEVQSVLSKALRQALNGHGFVAMIGIVGFGLFLVQLGTVVFKTRSRYGAFLPCPSSGREELIPSRLPLAAYRAIVIAFFSLLSVGTLWGLTDITSKALDAEWRVRFLEYYLGEMTAFATAFLGKHAAHGAPGYVLAAVSSVILMAPLFGTFARWVLRVARSIGRELCSEIRCDEGASFFESLTQPGLFAQLKEELGAKYLAVRKSGDPFVYPFGASITRSGTRHRSCVLVLDPLIFSLIRDPREREAMIWHEVGHAKQLSFARVLLMNVLFNVWTEHLSTALVDSFVRELKADAFATQRMGNRRHLQRALCLLSQLGWGAAPAERITFASAMRSALKLLLGFERLSYWHPHLDLRTRVLAEMHADD